MKELSEAEKQEVISDLKDFAQKSDTRYGKSIDRQIEDLEFHNEGMFDDDDESVRGEGRADLTFDMMRVPINGVINQYRKAPHIAKVEARTKQAEEGAKVMQGLIRGICRKGGQRNESVVSVDLSLIHI